MKIRYPAYYIRFRCLASDCPDSCCKEWAVQVDDGAARNYRALPGELGEALRTALREEEGDTVLGLTGDGRCPMWRQDGLCRIQAELGEDALCYVCRTFPRLRHDYGDFAELGLELSCPEAARLILAQDGWETVETTAPDMDIPEYDREAMVILQKGREELLDILQDRRLSAGQALAVGLLHSRYVQMALDGGEPPPFDAENALQEAQALAERGHMAAILDIFSGLEILTERWRCRLAKPVDASWSEPLRALARYGIQRYYLQAVSDYDLTGRVKLVILSCLVVKALGGDPVETAQLYAKEIENDAENVDTLLDLADASPALTDRKLLGLLLSE